MHKDTQEGCSTECYSDYLHRKKSSTAVGGFFLWRSLTPAASRPPRGADRGKTPGAPSVALLRSALCRSKSSTYRNVDVFWISCGFIAVKAVKYDLNSTVTPSLPCQQRYMSAAKQMIANSLNMHHFPFFFLFLQIKTFRI